MSKRPTITSANLVFLISIVLLLSFSALPLPLGWRLTVNELLLIALPLAVYFLLTRLPARATLQLHPVSGPIIALSFVTGLGFYLLDRWVLLLATLLTGYVPAYTPAILRSSNLSAVALAFGMVVLAPLIEEAMFRGVLQSAYARWGQAAAIAFPAILFALFHMDPIQTLFIVPLALALSWVAWRSGSLWAAVAMHAGNNLLAGVLVLLDQFAPGFTPPADSLISALVGLALAAAGIVTLRRILPHRTETPEPDAREKWLLKLWPLGIAVPLTAGLVLLTVMLSTFPQVLAFGLPVSLERVPWETPQTWEYDIQNAADEVVGEAVCTLTPAAETTQLECDVEQEAFAVTVERSHWQMGAQEEHLSVVWDSETLDIVEGTITGTRQDGAEYAVRLEPAGEGELRMVVSDGGATAAEETIPAESIIGGGRVGPLAVGDWPWRYTALPFSVLMAREASIAWPTATPVVEDVDVFVRTADVFPMASGDVITWRVSVGDNHTAWYAADAPHTLISYTDDMVTWVLRQP